MGGVDDFPGEVPGNNDDELGMGTIRLSTSLRIPGMCAKWAPHGSVSFDARVAFVR